MGEARNKMRDEDVEQAGRLFAENRSLRAAARMAGVNYSTFHARYKEFQRRQADVFGKSIGVEALKNMHEAAADVLSRSEKVRYEDQIRNLTRQLKERDAQDLTAEKISEYYFGLKDKPIEEPSWLVDPGSVGNTAGVPVTNWSDWHFAEVVDPAQVEGANEFNLEVFDRRYHALVERTMDLCQNHMTGKNYPGIVVNLGGDMISGNIHEELAQSNAMESIPAVLTLAGKIAWGLRQYADRFGHVFVPGVPGNHGRNTKKPQAKNACHTSFDWMIYKIVESHFKDDDRVKFYIPNGFDAYYRVFGHRILLTHGDRIGSKGGDGFIGVIGPIMRGAHKLRLSYAARGREIDTVMMGHWHNEIALPGLRVNNTLKGYDEWAMAMRFTPTPPSQDLFFIHHKRGVTASWPVQLEKRNHGQDGTQPWAAWPKVEV